jgi:hypothetical protein
MKSQGYLFLRYRYMEYILAKNKICKNPHYFMKHNNSNYTFIFVLLRKQRYSIKKGVYLNRI